MSAGVSGGVAVIAAVGVAYAGGRTVVLIGADIIGMIDGAGGGEVCTAFANEFASAALNAASMA